MFCLTGCFASSISCNLLLWSENLLKGLGCLAFHKWDFTWSCFPLVPVQGWGWHENVSIVIYKLLCHKQELHDLHFSTMISSHASHPEGRKIMVCMILSHIVMVSFTCNLTRGADMHRTSFNKEKHSHIKLYIVLDLKHSLNTNLEFYILTNKHLALRPNRFWSHSSRQTKLTQSLKLKHAMSPNTNTLHRYNSHNSLHPKNISTAHLQTPPFH